MPNGEIESVRSQQRIALPTDRLHVRQQAKDLHHAARLRDSNRTLEVATTSLRVARQRDNDAQQHPVSLTVEVRKEKVASSRTRAPNISASKEGTSELTFYPAYCHATSPTYFKWVNLTAHEIFHVLRHRDGYVHCWQSASHSHTRDAPQFLFYLNHPIQFVQVVGVVVNLEEWYDKFWLFTIDDSSGSVIDVICRKPEKGPSTTNHDTAEGDEEAKQEARDVESLSAQVAREVQIGKVLQIKGTVTEFQRNRNIDSVITKVPMRRGVVGVGKRNGVNAQVAKQEQAIRQIALSRLTSIHDTDQELTLIEARTRFYHNVLAKPWSVSRSAQIELQKKALGELEHDKKRSMKQAEKQRMASDAEQHDSALILLEYEAEQRARVEEAEKARIAAEQLQAMPVSVDDGARQHIILADARSHANNDPKESETGACPRDKKRKKRKSSKVATAAVQNFPAHGDTSMSFSADDAEKSALLRAAFG